MIAHLIRRNLIHRGIRYVLKWLTALERVLLIVGHQGVLAIGFIVARPADKVVLGAVFADNLGCSFYLQRDLIARVGARKRAHGFGALQIGIDIRLDLDRAGTVDRVQLHGGLDHSVFIHHGKTVRPNDIAAASSRLGFRPAHEHVVCARRGIDVADVIRW